MGSSKHSKALRGVTVAVIILAVVTVGAVVYAQSQDGGAIDRWVVKDKSSDPSPVALVNVRLMSATTTAAKDPSTTTERRRRGRVTRFHVANRTGPKHRRGRGGNVWCRTARAEGVGGNDLIHDLVHGTVSERFCWNPDRRKIVSLGGVNVSSGVSVAGSSFLWHTDGFGETVSGSGRTCDGKCWQYEYRRGQFKFARGLEINGVGLVQHIDVCASITMRGTGEVIVGHPRC